MFVFNVTSVIKYHILALHSFVMDITCFVTISLTTWQNYHVAQPQLTFHVEVLSTIPTLDISGDGVKMMYSIFSSPHKSAAS